MGVAQKEEVKIKKKRFCNGRIAKSIFFTLVNLAFLLLLGLLLKSVVHVIFRKL